METKAENNQFYYFVKRMMDIAIACAFFILFSPLYIATSFLIWLEDRHSPIYSHKRIGKGMHPFEFYKFRSMVHNADQILFTDAELYKQIRSGNNKIKNDPRVTKIGRFIRKYSIDETPQMFNVLRGDMSVIGPRPLRPDELEMYITKSSENKEKLNIIYTVKPGITGYWQVSGRSEIDFDKRIDMEVEYARRKSILFDIWILLMTPLAIIKAKGAEGY